MSRTWRLGTSWCATQSARAKSLDNCRWYHQVRQLMNCVSRGGHFVLAGSPAGSRVYRRCHRNSIARTALRPKGISHSSMFQGSQVPIRKPLFLMGFWDSLQGPCERGRGSRLDRWSRAPAPDRVGTCSVPGDRVEGRGLGAEGQGPRPRPLKDAEGEGSCRESYAQRDAPSG